MLAMTMLLKPMPVYTDHCIDDNTPFPPGLLHRGQILNSKGLCHLPRTSVTWSSLTLEVPTFPLGIFRTLHP